MLVMVSKSFEWTFTKKPLRKYELQEGQDTPIERPLSITNVLLDALDLFFNQRGLGWSWSSRPFPNETTPPPSIASVLAKILFKFTVLDISQYILDWMAPSLDKTGGGIFATLPLLPRTILSLLATFVNGLWAYAQMALMYHFSTLIGRILLRQPASHWPPFFRRPWMATSIREFWNVHWHQFFRHFFVVAGARPGGVLLGWPGAVMGAFAVSGLMHIAGRWAIGHWHVTELGNEGAFYLVMGVGVVLERVFERASGSRMRGWLGWLWTMGWILSWGSYFLDLRVGGGTFPVEFFPDHLRPGKMLIDGAISLFGKCG